MANKRKNPPAKWVLPAVINPPKRRCYIIEVPDEIQHIGAFYGALFNLTSARFWQDDTAHTALRVAAVWRDIFDNLRQQDCDAGECPVPIEEYEDEMSLCDQLRFDPATGKLQCMCCGTWEDVAGQSANGAASTPQPGVGTNPPTPGGCQTYNAEFNAQAVWYLPAVVNEGDTLQFISPGGSWSDGALGDLSAWWLPSGNRFFAGFDAGAPTHKVGDPSTTLNHMQLIALINGSYYPANTGTITVPSGVVNAEVVLLANTSSSNLAQGVVNVAVKLCNNQAAGWSHTLDFSINSWGFLNVNNSGWTPNFQGAWTNGSGWQGTDFVTTSGSTSNGIEIVLTFPTSVVINTLDLEYNLTKGTIIPGLTNSIELDAGGTTVVSASAPSDTDTDGTGKHLTITPGTYSGDSIEIVVHASFWTGSGTDGSTLLVSLGISGQGDDPFVGR